MSYPQAPKAPKPDPAIAAAQKAARQAEIERASELKKKQLQETKGQMGGAGIRSLISSAGGGFGRNFFG
jgi:hypothetical protein